MQDANLVKTVFWLNFKTNGNIYIFCFLNTERIIEMRGVCKRWVRWTRRVGEKTFLPSLKMNSRKTFSNRYCATFRVNLCHGRAGGRRRKGEEEGKRGKEREGVEGREWNVERRGRESERGERKAFSYSARNLREKARSRTGSGQAF